MRAEAWARLGIRTGQRILEDNSEIAAECKDAEYLMELFTVGGRPVNEDPNHKVKILINHGFAVGYSEKRRNPLWAVYKASGIDSGTTHRYERSQLFPRDLRTVPAVDGRTDGNSPHIEGLSGAGEQYLVVLVRVAERFVVVELDYEGYSVCVSPRNTPEDSQS